MSKFEKASDSTHELTLDVYLVYRKRTVVTIVDLGLGNLGSVANILRRIDASVQIAQTSREIDQATKLILPGVGAFQSGVRKIDELGLRGALLSAALERKIPLLGICLGGQLLGTQSEEGSGEGLGLLPMRVKRFVVGQLRVPHVGWSGVEYADPFLKGFFSEPLPSPRRYYFVHSFHFSVEDSSLIQGRTVYGEIFPSVLAHQNLIAAQFHPEKSHRFGMEFFAAFLKWKGMS